MNQLSWMTLGAVAALSFGIGAIVKGHPIIGISFIVLGGAALRLAGAAGYLLRM